MFVTVRYGEDQKHIFNINCRNEVLLYQIKKRCKMDLEDAIELSDEKGVVKNLRQHLDHYGSDYLKERETVILLRVDSCVFDHMETEEGDHFPDRVLYIPMLTGLADNQEFIETLNPKNVAENPAVDDPDGKVKKSKSKDKKKDVNKKEKNNKHSPPKK